MIYMPYNNFTEVKMPEWITIPQGIYISQEAIITTLVTNVRKGRRNENRGTSAEH